MNRTDFSVPAFVFFAALMVSGCRPDGRNLEKTVDYFNRDDIAPTVAYEMLSSQAKVEHSREQYEAYRFKDPKKAWPLLRASDSQPYSDFLNWWNSRRVYRRHAKVLREEIVDDTSFAAVSVEGNSVDSKVHEIYTATWVKEGDYWKRHWVYKLVNEASRLHAEGRYNEASEKALLALKVNPFDMRAFAILANSLSCGSDEFDNEALRRIFLAIGFDLNTPFHREIRALTVKQAMIDEVVKRMLAINPEDTTANAVAMLYTEDPTLARPFLSCLKGTSRYQDSLFNLCQQCRNPEDSLTLLNAEVEIHGNLLGSKLLALARLARWEDCRSLLLSPGVKAELLDWIASSGPIDGAVNAWTIGTTALGAGDKVFCDRIIEKVAITSHGQRGLRDLVQLMEKPNPVESARNVFKTASEQLKSRNWRKQNWLKH